MVTAEHRRSAARSCATRPPTCWPRPCCGCGPAPTSPSGRSSRTASTTTSSCPAAPTSPTRTSSGSTPRCARSWPRTSPSSATSTRIDEGLALFADQPFKREIIEAVGAGAGRGRRRAGGRGRRTAVSTYWNSPAFTDLCRGPHVPVHRRARPLRADAGGRRLLARRREAPAAPAHLRHGLGVRGGPGRAPPPPGGGRAARPPQARRRARPVQLPRRDRRGPGRLPPQGRHRPPADGGLLAASATSDGGYEFVNTPHITKAELFETSGHLEWFADGMYPPMELDGGQQYYLKPMNCPFHMPDLQEPPALATASCRCGCSSSAPSTATRSRASSTG